MAGCDRNKCAGKFQLIMHTGSSGEDTGDTAASSVAEIDLETPTSVTRFDSWAAIVE